MKKEPRGQPACGSGVRMIPSVTSIRREGGVDRAPERSDGGAGAGQSVQPDEQDARDLPRRIAAARTDVPPAH
jgi:hypothetical protein